MAFQTEPIHVHVIVIDQIDFILLQQYFCHNYNLKILDNAILVFT